MKYRIEAQMQTSDANGVIHWTPTTLEILVNNIGDIRSVERIGGSRGTPVDDKSDGKCWRCGDRRIAGDPSAKNKSAAVECPACCGTKGEA